MTKKAAFADGRFAAVRRDADLPDYSHVFRKRTRHGGTVTDKLVAKLLKDV